MERAYAVEKETKIGRLSNCATHSSDEDGERRDLNI